MSRSRSLYCHSDTGPTGPTALILREQIRSSLSRPFILGHLSEITWLTSKAPSFRYSYQSVVGGGQWIDGIRSMRTGWVRCARLHSVKNVQVYVCVQSSLTIPDTGN